MSLFKRRGKIVIVALLILGIVSSFSLPCYAKINKGIWYHQQPTSENDDGPFYGGSSTYEGFCGPTSIAMGLQYFIPNIHKKLYDIYGEADYHNDGRGGLKSKDPYVYSKYTTYTFEDFLGHKYIGRHITTSGCSYSELRSIITGVDNDVSDYTAQTAWITLSQLRDYLDNGWLAVMNTVDGHYILIGGWDGSTTDPDQRYYYIWDPWKNPLGMSSYTYTTSLAGNAANYGTAQTLTCYKITATTLTNKFRDQRGDGTLLAFKFTPNDLPASATTVAAKAVWLLGSTARNMGVANVVDTCAAHGVTDIFLLVKGTDGNFVTTTLDDVINAAYPKGIKVHAWVIVLNDHLKASTGSYATVGGDWIDARDTSYRNYIINNIITPLVRDHDIDGIHLDCIRYPGNANNYSGAQDAITTYCSLIRQKMNQYKPNIPLSAATMAEGSSTATYYGQNVANMSQYLQFITPMTYTHNYKYKPSWVGAQTSYFVGQAVSGCEIWAGIQTLDDDGNYMTPLEMKQCVDYARANGATGVAYFRYPLASWQWEQSDKWNISASSAIAGRVTEASTDRSRYVPGDPVVVTLRVKNTGSQTLQSPVVEWTIKDPNNVVKAVYTKIISQLTPNEISTQSDTYTLPVDAAIGIWKVEYVFKTSDGTILDSSSLNGHSPISFTVEGTTLQGEIVSQATNQADYYPANKVIVTVGVKNIGTATLTDAKVQLQYKNPDNTMVATSTITIPNLGPGASASVEDSALTLGSVPLDVDGQWTVVVTFLDSSGVVLDSRSDLTFNVYRTVSKAQYMDMAKRCADWMDAHYSDGYHTYPNYVNVGDGRTVSLAQMTDILARALRYYKDNGIWPNYVRIRSCEGPLATGEMGWWRWKDEGRSDDGGYTYYNIAYVWDSQHNGPEYKYYVETTDFLDACSRIAGFIDENLCIPNYVRVFCDYYSPSRWLSAPACQSLYMMARVVRYYNTNGVMPNCVGLIHMTVPQTKVTWEQNPDE
ncbi:MAG: hypothetical protein HPY74_10170 [Firmicutes bacterium]|nr:hypothetical protein [Bacillota bacterium]